MLWPMRSENKSSPVSELCRQKRAALCCQNWFALTDEVAQVAANPPVTFLAQSHCNKTWYVLLELGFKCVGRKMCFHNWYVFADMGPRWGCNISGPMSLPWFIMAKKRLCCHRSWYALTDEVGHRWLTMLPLPFGPKLSWPHRGGLPHRELLDWKILPSKEEERNQRSEYL